MFLDTFKGDSRASELSKISLEVFQGSLRQFQRCFREVSRAFKESVKYVSINFQGVVKNVLMKFCFVILLLLVLNQVLFGGTVPTNSFPLFIFSIFGPCTKMQLYRCSYFPKEYVCTEKTAI